MSFLNLSIYRFQALNDLESWRRELHMFCSDQGLKGTILLAPEGVNAFVAGDETAVGAFENLLREKLSCPELEGKRSWSSTQPFQRMKVRLKKEIITFRQPEVHPENERAPSISPRELFEWYQKGHDFEILDTRNVFEYDLGSFEKAEHLHLKHFGEFPERVEALPDEWREKPVVIFCTGGIRCEKAGLYMMKKGFKDVRQLEGGILKYFEECGGDHYRGQCFVFDERETLNPALDPEPASGPLA